MVIGRPVQDRPSLGATMRIVAPGPRREIMPLSNRFSRCGSVGLFASWRSLLVLAAVAVAIAATAIDMGDFSIFYKGGRALLAGQSPYTVPGFFSPLHFLLYAGPIALLPYNLAYHLNAFLSALVFLLIFWRLARGSIADLLIMCAAPWLLFVTWYGNNDWLVMLGLFVNPIAGVFLLMLKPQIGIFPALLLLLQLPRRVAAGVVVALVLIFGASFAVGMRWGGAVASDWNTAFFPVTAVLAIPIVLYALRRRRSDVALSVAPALPPYVSPHSWCVMVIWLSRYRWSLLLFSSLSWFLLLAWRLGR